MLRMPDRWIYAVECNINKPKEKKDDWRYNMYNWDWDEAYDSIETIGKMYTRGEAVDMIFNKNYTFVRYLATQYFTWENGVVTFIKNTVLKREVMTLDEIWDKLPENTPNCDECYGSCAQCVYRKVDTESDKFGGLIVKDIHCLYNIKDEMLQSMAKGNHYCKHFICLHMLSKKNKSKC